MTHNLKKQSSKINKHYLVVLELMVLVQVYCSAVVAELLLLEENSFLGQLMMV